jgi:hypothetical protein
LDKEVLKKLYCDIATFIKTKKDETVLSIVEDLKTLNQLKDVSCLIDEYDTFEFANVSNDYELELLTTMGDILDLADYADENSEDDAYMLYVYSCKILYCLDKILGESILDILKRFNGVHDGQPTL